MNFYMIIILVVLAILGYNYIKRKGINVNEINGSGGSASISMSNSPFSDIYPSSA